LHKQTRRRFLQGTGALAGAVGFGAVSGRASAFSRAVSDGADLVVVNARVWTGDPFQPAAQAFAIKDGLFVAVGSNEQIREWSTSSTRVDDAKGLYIVPGMIDCHNHGSGQRILYRPVVGNPYTIEFFTVDRIVEILSEAAAKTPEGHWVAGAFFDDTKLENGAQLRKEDLDRVSTEHPVRVDHRGGHTSWYNSKAFELAGITRDSPDPEFGSFVRDEEGNLTGQVAEDANDLFEDIAPDVELPPNAAVDGLAYISQKFAEFGLTTVHMSSPDIAALRELRSKGQLRHRANVEFRRDAYQAVVDEGLTTGAGDDWIRLGALSEYAVDGSFSERTLRTVAPYQSKRPPTGLFTASQDETNELVEWCMRNGVQVNLHINGDAAIDRGLTAIERAQKMIPEPRSAYVAEFRPKLTHCTILNEDLALAKRIKAANAVPQLFTSYIYYNSEKWHLYGEDIMSRAMAFRTMVDHSIPVVQGTDFYPGPFDPLMSLQGMVTRTGWDGETWGANQAVSVDEALKILTLNGAFASYEEDVKGSISPGKLADYVVLSDDPHDAPDKILDLEIVRTVIGGVPMYEK
jgi:predicted amidohydrolase YtcJ